MKYCKISYIRCLQYPQIFLSLILISSTMRKIPKFHLTSWSGNSVETRSFHRVSSDSPKTLLLLCISTNVYGLLCSGSDLLIFSRKTYLINIFLENCKCMKCRKKGEKEKLYQSQVGKQIRFSNFNLYFVLVFNCDGYFERRLGTRTINSWNC